MTERGIYHITHVANLASIISEGRLWCDEQRIRRGLENKSIGYSHIKARRMRRPVVVAAGGTLGSYVPFNFCARSVMLYVISQGHEVYQEGQAPLLHLVSSIEAAVATGRPWFFTDRHADLAYARQLGSLDQLGEVDWTAMSKQQWGGDQELKQRRQAEFLVHDWFQWEAIESIGVIDSAVASQVQALLAGAAHKPRVEVRRDWYYR